MGKPRTRPYPTKYPTNEAGVTLGVERNTPFWRASYVDDTGTFRLQRFSCREHGYDEAYRKAVRARYKGLSKRPPKEITAPPVPRKIAALLNRPKFGTMTAQQEKNLRRWYPDPTLSLASLAVKAGLSEGTLRKYAKQLGLERPSIHWKLARRTV